MPARLWLPTPPVLVIPARVFDRRYWTLCAKASMLEVLNALAKRVAVSCEGQGSDPPARIYRLATEDDQRQHRQFLHPKKGIVVTVPGQPGKDVPVGTLKAILRSAGLETKEEN